MKAEENAPDLLRRSLQLIASECTQRQFTLNVPTKEAETIANLALKPNFTTQNHETALKTLHDALIKSESQTQQRLLRLIPNRLMSRVLQSYTLKEESLRVVIPFIGVLLQCSDAHNLQVLQYCISRRQQIQNILAKSTQDLLIGLVRCLQAQPILAQSWDFSPLFLISPHHSEDPLINHLQRTVCPQLCSTEDNTHAHQRVDLVQSLLFNKHEETLLREQDSTSITIEVVESSSIVNTAYMNHKASQLVDQMESAPFGHICISGPQGSGKMSLLQLTQDLYTQRHHTKPGMIVITLESSFDSKNLVGTYVCNETGDFQFKKGPLTVAAEQGMWLVLRNIEETPSDLLSFLLPLVQENQLQVTSTMTIRPTLGFRLCFLRKVTEYQHEDIKPLTDLLFTVSLDALIGRADFELILRARYPSLFIDVAEGMTVSDLLVKSVVFLNEQLQSVRPHLLDFRQPTVSQIFSLYARVNVHFENFLKQGQTITISQHQRQLIIEELSDVYIAYMYDSNLRHKILTQLTLTHFNTKFNSLIDADAVSEYCTKLGREHGISPTQCFFGRTSLPRKDVKLSNSTFVYTSATCRLLEQITTGIQRRETCLLVGETGTGKTTAVQEIARVIGKPMHVFNLNQNTDSADLLGGYKPVDLKYLLKPIYENFLAVFLVLFQKTSNNQKFLDLTQKCYESSKIKEFCQCMQHGMTSIKSKKDQQLQPQIAQIDQQLKDLQKRTKKLETQGGFIFQFVEGTLIKSMQNGDWVLLDEINLASESILNKLATIIQGNHVMLNERADVIEMNIHPEFRVFMCMNPPYSSAGKKQLPQALRSKLAEIYVPEIDNESDLWSIIDKYTKASQQSTLNEENKRTILQFYIQVRILVARQTKRGNIGLRNLCRALKFMNAAIQLKYPVVKAIYDSLFACFASHLDAQMQEMVKTLIFTLFKIKQLPRLSQSAVKDERFAYVEDSLILLGKHKPALYDEKEFILTPSFKNLVNQLASVISVSDFAVILEGPTSAGKTSCINYLAKVTHNHVIRINNHMHTDVQEYLGSYVPDALTGKLGFQEGILVEAVRKGYWVILDELNLAPSEVLEALNRLLDDNRELHIVETQKVIKAHPQFRIFATQNPTEGYGGRKELSEAFKNRFVMIKVRDVPIDELSVILEQKCQLPASRAALMVKVMESLQIYRSQTSVFSGKDSTITVRDLLKWAGRINANSHLGSHVDQYQIALEGFLVLAERSREARDKKFIQDAIEKVFSVKLNLQQYYEDFFNAHLLRVFSDVPKELNLPPIILSRQFKRLAVLVYKCLVNHEPVLLVGETGCGKTTLCQLFARSVLHQELFAINCHQNTETSDFIGCMRTRKNLSSIQENLIQLLAQQQLTDEQKNHAKTLSLKKRAQYILQITKDARISTAVDDLNCVFEWTDGILVNAMQQGGLLLIDEISLANDSVLERLNSVFEHDRTLVISEKSSAEAVKIVASDKFNMVATMNPGSDFGKKELSPALRNRMTEIWVESYFTQPELAQCYQGAIVKDVSSEVDLFLIISTLCEKTLANPQVALGIFNMICFVNFTLAARYFSMQRKALSIRDILNIIDFIKRNTAESQNLIEPLRVQQAFKNAVELVIVDGLCLGIDVAGQQEQDKIMRDCREWLDLVCTELFEKQQQVAQDDDIFINTVAQIGVSPFVMPRAAFMESQFAFSAQTTKRNLKKLLRAFTLGKPVLIEGSPGVGKTSLVENLARQTGKRLIRVNLSDQTDMMDLLGSEYPVPNADDDQDIQFSWCDGVLLQAIREGHWFLIDEMNLAQQSILEGLNAILDHRRTVYIPELNQEFVCHPDFFVFACQNPSQSSGQTSGRKTLPKSFLNRFAKIYLEDLQTEDYRVILHHQASDIFTTEQVNSLLQMTQSFSSSDKQVNMRDLARFLKIYRYLSDQDLDQQKAIATALETCYGEWRKGIEYGLITDIEMPVTSLVRALSSHVQFESLHTTKLQQHNDSNDSFKFEEYQELKGPHAKQLQSLVDCLHANLPVLVVTNDPQRFSRSLQVLAKLSQTKLKRILLNERSDTTQLLGCFEQVADDCQHLLTHKQLTPDLLKLRYELQYCHTDSERQRLMQTSTQGQSKFEWVDSVLVQAVERGHWTAIENANLCNASVLDRLNGLFEEGAQSLPINEQGLVNNHLRSVQKHHQYRAVFVISQKTLDEGKDISKALRNRCLEIKINFCDDKNQYNQLEKSSVQGTLQLLKYQKEHDLLPTVKTNDQSSPSTVKLGKRSSPIISRQDVVSLRQLEMPDLDEQIRSAYSFYLPLLESADVNAFQSYLQSAIKHLQQALLTKMSGQILENQLQAYLNHLLTAQASNLVEIYILLKNLDQQSNLRQLTSNPFLIYLAPQQQGSQGLPVSQDFDFITQATDFTLLKQVPRPNTNAVQFLKKHQLADFELYVYKLPTAYMLEQPNESRFSTVLRQLKHNGATVILIDTEKEITVKEDKIVRHLEETCFDRGAVLQTPYLVMIPKSLQEGVVVASQSFVYESLCYIKDYIKLHKELGRCEHIRLSKIPKVLSTPNFDHCLSLTIKQLTLQVLESSFFDQAYQKKLIKSVLIDEKSVSLKDLPSAYAVSHSLIYKMQELQALRKSTQFSEMVSNRLAVEPDQDFIRRMQGDPQCINLVGRAFNHLQQLRTAEVIKALFVLPLEVQKQKEQIELAKQEILAETFFWQYHLRDKNQPELLLKPKSENLNFLETQLQELVSLAPKTDDYSQTSLRNTLQFITILKEDLQRVYQDPLNVQAVDQLANLVFKQIDTVQFASVSNILTEMVMCVTAVVAGLKQLLQDQQLISQETRVLVGLESQTDHPFYVQMFKAGKQLTKDAQEMNMKFLLKQLRLHNSTDFKLQSAILDHFVQREVIKRMILEDAHQLRFTLPFYMKEQKMPKQAPVGKAMDEWTAQDKAKMEAEAEREIELNFPSYFDEVQKAYYSGQYVKDATQELVSQVSLDDVLAELLELQDHTESVYRAQFLQDRLQVVHESLSLQPTIYEYQDYIDDLQSYMQHQLTEQKLKQVMNIQDVQLAASYNFYHSPLPQEFKLVYQPLVQLQLRLRDIMIRDQYESPLLNESLFLSNYILACFNVEVTPLMKLLTCMEFLLQKLEEWENTYASKRLNSVESEINSLKLLVIRYRKIQILSWRNLLNWKKDRLVRDDFENSIRLAHTICKQVFEGQEDVLKLMDLCDLFIRDATLATYMPRLTFISILRQHLVVKQQQVVKMSDRMRTRLQQAINALQFVHSYYAQFQPKLDQTIKRLDQQARDKVKLMIDISKWTLQKFEILRSNVDKTHRQLNKACKDEEEILIQNVQSLVLQSSRKKFGGQNDQLLSLDIENKVFARLTSFEIQSDDLFVKQLSFLENSKIKPQWPSCQVLQESIDLFMERLQEVRALNKKYLQKKAFYDLLKYMRDEGLRPNFQQEFQATILQCESQMPYFYRAYETYVMLKGSVQSEEIEDLKAVDVLRCQGFSQHLMHRILELTITIQQLDALKLNEQHPIKSPTQQFVLNEQTYKQVNRLLKSLREKLKSASQQCAVMLALQQTKLESVKQLIGALDLVLPSCEHCDQIFEGISSISGLITTVLSEKLTKRESRVITSLLQTLSHYDQSLKQFIGVPSLSQQLQKRHQLLESQTKLFYQDLLKLLDTQGKRQRSDSVDNSTMEQASPDERYVLTMEEQQSFTQNLLVVFKQHLPQIQQTGNKIMSFANVKEPCCVQSQTVEIMRKVRATCDSLLSQQQRYLESMAKFAYLSQRVFLYLIHQGFCGQEDEDDPDVEPPSDLEKDGMGMGDGKGGDDNVADQIEHEEQLEGLKDYDSDQEKPDKNSDQQNDKDQEENDFEMKNDFDGDMDSDQKSQKSDRSKSDEDDQEDQVDDQLDNDLWNRNMEDMEEREEKEEKEKREQDLGERELQDENVMDQESDMAEGDHDKDEKPKESKDQKDKDHEMAEEDKVEEEDDQGSEQDDQDDVGLNQDSMPAEPDEDFSQESESEPADQEMAEDPEADDSKSQQDSSGYEEQSQHSNEDSNLEEQDGSQENSDLDVKNDVNQAVLEDDQIQANEQEKQNDQANLKKKQEDKKVDPSSNQQQEQKQETQESQQADPNGQDLLFNFAQKLEQQQKQKPQQPEPTEPQTDKPKVEQPQMVDSEQPRPPEIEQNEAADEYMFDEQAQQMEGKLAADKIKDNDAQEGSLDEEMAEFSDQAADENPEEQADVEMTQQEAQSNPKNLNTQKAQQQKDTRQEDMEESKEQEIVEDDLIRQYNDYLAQKQDVVDLTQQQQEHLESESVGTRIIQQLDQFDYLHQKQLLREMFQLWQQNPILHQESLDLLSKFKNQTQAVTSSLCEQLRIVLEPQLSQNLQGDFKTGKRLNMKKVISFIASNYRNDKIWLRRTLPSKRDYKILIAIDDSLSMKESNLGFFSLEASVALGEALNRLEVGKVAVARIRDRLQLVQSFEDNYSAERAAHIVSAFDFKYCGKTSADTAMANFVSDANKLLDMQNSSAAVSCPFVIVLSDGRFNKDNVRRYMREAKEKKYLYIFVVLDKKGGKDQSIMQMRSAVKQANGGIKLDSYMKDFPFDYYCVVSDMSQLPQSLGTILVQWFSMVVNQ